MSINLFFLQIFYTTYILLFLNDREIITIIINYNQLKLQSL